MTLKLLNKTLGLTLLLLGFLFIIPLTVFLFKSGGGPWGFGLMLLPVLLPLGLATLFGFFGLMNYEKNFEGVKKFYMLAHMLTALAGTISCILIPLFPFPFVAISIACILFFSMTASTAGRNILITNLLILFSFLLTLYFLFSFSELSLYEQLLRLWK